MLRVKAGRGCVVPPTHTHRAARLGALLRRLHRPLILAHQRNAITLCRAAPNAPKSDTGPGVGRAADNPMDDDALEPSYDDLVLDDEYYKEMGVTKEEALGEMEASAEDLDPDGMNISFDDVAAVSEDVPESVRQVFESKDMFGPEVSPGQTRTWSCASAALLRSADCSC
jgi:hypothetical protein